MILKNKQRKKKCQYSWWYTVPDEDWGSRFVLEIHEVVESKFVETFPLWGAEV